MRRFHISSVSSSNVIVKRISPAALLHVPHLLLLSVYVLSPYMFQFLLYALGDERKICWISGWTGIHYYDKRSWTRPWCWQVRNIRLVLEQHWLTELLVAGRSPPPFCEGWRFIFASPIVNSLLTLCAWWSFRFITEVRYKPTPLVAIYHHAGKTLPVNNY